MIKKVLISEYKAAALTAMSPTLLRWLTSHAPKHGTKRKLRVAKSEGNIYFFDEKEVLDFNSWLKKPWPRKDGRRPHIPVAIRREIKDEANGACAICKSHGDTCEAAHLDLIAKNDNNHPDNLLWLCANHHVAYDNGRLGPDKENRDFVTSFKKLLRRYRVMLWRTQHEVSHKLFIVLESCNGLKEQLDAAETKEQVEVVEELATETLAVLPALAQVSKSDHNYAVYEKISADAIALREDKSSIAKRLRRAQRIRKKYVSAFGFVMCPLCKGSGRHEGTDCPVCNGDREIEQRLADVVDLRAYELVDCPICDGEGRYQRNDCPACGGEARMARRDAESIDLRDYEEVDCPLCDGEGRYEQDDCPACGGEARMARRDAESIDLRDYEEVDCPLCDGEGRYERDDCPACGGEARMARRDAESIDLRDYEEVDCPLCDGEGRYERDDCPACGGEARMARRDAESIDLRDYEEVDCPLCDGEGRYERDDCPVCDGEARMARHDADSIDLRDYDKVDCPVCDGQGRRNGDDCPACDGEGQLQRRFGDRIDPREYSY